jgi:hypothetical protein
MRLDRLTLNRSRWPKLLRRFSIAWDTINLSVLALILLVVIWGAFRP